MKRNIILLSIIIVVFLGLVFGVVYFVSLKPDNNNDEPVVENNFQTIQYKVYKGQITHTCEVEGQVISEAPEIYLKEIRLDNITDSNFSLLKNKGDKITPKEVLYKYKGKEKSVDYNGMIVDIRYETYGKNKSVTIQLLNYDALYIVTQIDAEKLDKINYHTEVVAYQNQSETPIKINQIGYEISNNKVAIYLSLPDKMLPGTEVNIKFILGVVDAGLYLSKDAIIKDGDDYCVLLQKEAKEEPERIKVKVGQNFSITEDDNTFDFVEILSGVKEGDIIVVKQLNNTGSSIKENILNE